MAIVITQPGKKPTVNKQVINKPISIDAPVTPFSVDNFIVGPGLHAGTIDNENIGISGMNGVGLWQLGFYGINTGTLTYVLSNSTNDYSTTDHFTEFGYVEKSEFRLGDDVSADSDGVITGSHYIRYRPSVGLEIVGGNITISSGNYVWIGNDFDNGIGLAENISGVSGLVATHGSVVTTLINSTTGGFTFGSSGGPQVTYDPTDSTPAIQLTNTNLNITSSSTDTGYLWVGSAGSFTNGVGVTYQGILGRTSGVTKFQVDTNGYFYCGNDVSDRGDSAKFIAFDNTGLFLQNLNLDIYNNSSVKTVTATSNGTFAVGNDVSSTGLNNVNSKFMSFDGSDLKLQNVNLNLNGSGYIWVGDETFTGGGVGLAHLVGSYTGFVGVNSLGVVTVNIDDSGNMMLGDSTNHQLNFNATSGELTLDGANIGVDNNSYVWVGDTDLSNGCGLAGGISGFTDGFYATHSGNATAFISATDGTFQFGPDGKCVKYDGSTLTVTGSNLTLSSGNYVWVGAPFVGVGFNDSGLLATDSVGTTTAYILASDGSFAFGKSGGNQLSYSPSTGAITLNGATISDWANIGGSNLPAQNATVGATAGTNMYSSGGSTIPEAEVLNYTQGRGAYDGVSFPDITGKPMAINAYITTGGTGGWYKVASVTFGGQYGAFSFNGLFSKGESDGRITTQSRVKLGCTSDASNNVAATFYRYSGDNPTTYLKLRYSGTTVTLYCWLAQYDSVVLQGNWTCYPKSGGSSWFDNYQTDLDTIGSSDPGGTNVTATANYELEATVGATAGTNLYRGSGSTLDDSDVITSLGTASDVEYGSGKAVNEHGADVTGDNTASDVEYGSGKAVYQAHADRTSYNTAYNTARVNGGKTESGYVYDVYGDVHMNNGTDISFYTGDGTGYCGGIYASSGGVYMATETLARISGAGVTLHAGDGTISLQASDGPITSNTGISPTGSYDLGSSSYKWNYLYSTYLGSGSCNVTRSFIYDRYIYDSSGNYSGRLYGYNSGNDVHLEADQTLYLTGGSGYGTYIANKVRLPTDITCGSATHDSSHNFKLHYWHAGDSRYYDLDCYITNW